MVANNTADTISDTALPDMVQQQNAYSFFASTASTPAATLEGRPDTDPRSVAELMEAMEGRESILRRPS